MKVIHAYPRPSRTRLTPFVHIIRNLSAYNSATRPLIVTWQPIRACVTCNLHLSSTFKLAPPHLGRLAYINHNSGQAISIFEIHRTYIHLHTINWCLRFRSLPWKWHITKTSTLHPKSTNTATRFARINMPTRFTQKIMACRFARTNLATRSTTPAPPAATDRVDMTPPLSKVCIMIM